MKADNIMAGPLPDIDALETISFWRDDLSKRLKVARLRQELIGLDPEVIVALGDEAAEFSRLVVLKGVLNA